MISNHTTNENMAKKVKTQFLSIDTSNMLKSTVIQQDLKLIEYFYMELVVLSKNMEIFKSAEN